MDGPHPRARLRVRRRRPRSGCHRPEEALLARAPDAARRTAALSRLGDDVAQLDGGHQGSAGRAAGGLADLVEEGQRARVALEGAADELAQGGLGLALDGRGLAQAGDRLDVQALVGLQELERLERQAGPVVRRARAALAHDAAERRDPAEPLVRLEDAVAFDAAIHLGSLAELIEQVHLVPARDAARRHPGVQQLVGPLEERVQRFRRRAAPRGSGRSARRGTTPSRPISSESRRTSQACPTRTSVTTSKVRPRARPTVSSANGSRLPPSREVGRRTPLAIALSLPPVGVMSVRTRSASPRSNLDRTIASVV